MRVDLSDCPLQRAAVAGHFYASPGLCGPEMTFDAQASDYCAKNYPTPSGTSPGVILSCCLCPVPIMLDVSAMVEAERLSTILSIILLFFWSTTRVVYDAACNLLWCALQRVPMLLRGKRVIVDTFHYRKGHTCGATFTASTVHELDGARLSVGEALNKRLKEVGSSARYARPELFIVHVALRAITFNLQARWRRRTRHADTEGANINAEYNRICPCDCERCVAGRANSASGFDQFERRRNGETYITRKPHAWAIVHRLTDKAARKRRQLALDRICGWWKLDCDREFN